MVPSSTTEGRPGRVELSNWRHQDGLTARIRLPIWALFGNGVKQLR